MVKDVFYHVFYGFVKCNNKTPGTEQSLPTQILARVYDTTVDLIRDTIILILSK